MGVWGVERGDRGGMGRGGPEYANTPRNGGKGGWEGEDRSMQIPREKGGWEGEDRSMQIPREMGGRGAGKGRTGVCKYPEDGSMQIPRGK